MCLVIDGSPETLAKAVADLEGREDLESEWDSEKVLEISVRNTNQLRPELS